MPKRIDLSGKIINHWKINNYIGNSKYNCTCLLCDNEYEVFGYKITKGISKSCSKCASKLNAERNRIKLENTVINDWYVEEYVGYGKYRCKCKCGNYDEIEAHQLLNNKTHRCKKCNNTIVSDKLREKLEGTTIGELYVEEYIGNSMYKCRCSCNNEHIITTYGLKTNKYLMCSKCFSFNRKNLYRETMYNRYGDIASSKINNAREEWQLEVLNDKSKMQTVIDKMTKDKGRLPTSTELANILDISEHILLTYTRQYFINLYSGNSSNGEFELREMLKDYNVLYNNRSAIHPLELDIYIPEKKLAIEFNGTYWHSSEFKDCCYHQDKTIACAKQGIQLIHIFEYEWNNDILKNKIIEYLNIKLGRVDINYVYARNTEIRNVSVEDTKQFLNNTHLQGYSNSSINIGLYYKDLLVGIMTFGKPRFNNDFEYELIRMSFANNTIVVGGAEKMFKHFIKTYTPDSILSYCDITKFSGNTYLKLGFSTNKESLTSPNYVWVNPKTNEVLPRYKTMKHKLVEMGLGNITQTEDEIMYKLGYYKVYNSGNLKFYWYNSQA